MAGHPPAAQQRRSAWSLAFFATIDGLRHDLAHLVAGDRRLRSACLVTSLAHAWRVDREITVPAGEIAASSERQRRRP